MAIPKKKYMYTSGSSRQAYTHEGDVLNALSVVKCVTVYCTQNRECFLVVFLLMIGWILTHVIKVNVLAYSKCRCVFFFFFKELTQLPF